MTDQQGGDGAWTDKWHASPYYATMCVVTALREVESEAADIAKTIEPAVGWVLATQRRDGSWGHFAGTAEETAYALQILLYKARLDRRTRAAARRGYAFLVAAEGSDPVELWHGKDLYDAPHIVRAAVVGARHLAETTLGLTERGSAIRAIPRQRTILAG